VLAEAVQSLWPGTQVTIGPVIENGFYYDFFRNEPFTPEDFAAIEKKMREIIARDKPFTKEGLDREKTKQVFATRARTSRSSWSTPFPATSRSRSIPGRLVRSVPRPAHDLDRQDRQRVQADEGGRRLLARRFSNNPMLTRIYGTAWRQAGRARRLPQADRGSREARPSQARPRARPVPLPGGRSGRGVLARQGLDASSRR
jgi:threonyl-tRNA synthetase